MDDVARLVPCWLGQLSRALVDFARFALAIPLVLGLVTLAVDPLDGFLGAQPAISNFSRVPAETSWSILSVWRACARLEFVQHAYLGRISYSVTYYDSNDLGLVFLVA